MNTWGDISTHQACLKEEMRRKEAKLLVRAQQGTLQANTGSILSTIIRAVHRRLVHTKPANHLSARADS